MSLVAALGARRPQKRSVHAGLKHIRRKFHAELAAIAPYKGGLLLELRSSVARKAAACNAARLAARQLWLSRQGRRIDLVGLLSMRRQDGLHLWAIKDPVSGQADEGKYDTDGTYMISGRWIKIGPKLTSSVKGYMPIGGIPPIPQTVRPLVTSKSVRKRAIWVGLLYQPAEWLEVRPDPAIVVEWKDRPGEYYALAVWGHDGPRIMEFVD